RIPWRCLRRSEIGAIEVASRLGSRHRGAIRLPYLANRYLLELLATAVNQRDDTARDEDRREHRRHDTEAVDDREAAHRASAERQQRKAGDQRRHVRVENRVPGSLVARLD